MSYVYFAAILTILLPSWRQNRYCLLYITGHGPVRARKYVVVWQNGPVREVSCYLRAVRATKVLARAISNGQDQDWISCRILAIFLDQDWIWIHIFEKKIGSGDDQDIGFISIMKFS